LMPWAAYVGLAAVIVSALALIIGLSGRDWRGIALALVALIGGALIAYVPWHYDQLRQALPPIHDITTDPDNPPTFVAVVPLRQGEGINSVAYEGARIAEQQRRAYPEILPLTVGLRPDAAFARALETAQRMGWTIVASDKSAGRIEASQEAAGWALPTISSSGSLRRIRVAASTCARLHVMGAATSVSTPSAFAIILRPCRRRSRSSSLRGFAVEGGGFELPVPGERDFGFEPCPSSDFFELCSGPAEGPTPSGTESSNPPPSSEESVANSISGASNSPSSVDRPSGPSHTWSHVLSRRTNSACIRQANC
jgi:hypothetical protein